MLKESGNVCRETKCLLEKESFLMDITSGKKVATSNKKFYFPEEMLVGCFKSRISSCLFFPSRQETQSQHKMLKVSLNLLFSKSFLNQ